MSDLPSNRVTFLCSVKIKTDDDQTVCLMYYLKLSSNSRYIGITNWKKKERKKHLEIFRQLGLLFYTLLCNLHRLHYIFIDNKTVNMNKHQQVSIPLILFSTIFTTAWQLQWETWYVVTKTVMKINREWHSTSNSPSLTKRK